MTKSTMCLLGAPRLRFHAKLACLDFITVEKKRLATVKGRHLYEETAGREVRLKSDVWGFFQEEEVFFFFKT